MPRAKAPFPIRDHAYDLIEYIERRVDFESHQALWLGGAPGSPGSVAPPGGYIGQLPQNRVQWDGAEAEYWSGGSTLMDNLARDRKRLTTYMQQVAYPNSQGSGVSAGSFPSWGSGAWIVGFSAGSPPGCDTVQDAIQYLYNEGAVGPNKTFLALDDTPASYSGQTGLVAKVNATEDALEFGYALGAGNLITRYRSDGGAAVEYDADSAGLDSATSAGSAGDTIWLPSVTITGDHVLGDNMYYVGVSRDGSKLTGQITLGIGTTLNSLTVVRTANDSDTLKGVIAAASGVAKVRDCDISVEQSGSGDVYAISVESAGNIHVWNSYVYGGSSGGSGYAAFKAPGAGDILFFGGWQWGTTDEFYGDV